MLKKLYKNEYRALFKSFLPIYIALFGLALLSRLTFVLKGFDNSIIEFFERFTTSLYVVSIFALFIVGTVIVVVRFYKSLLSKQGYLTFSLPVKTTDHIICKIICGVSLTLINAAATLLSLFVMGIGTDFSKQVIKGIKEAVKEVIKALGKGDFIAVCVLCFVLLIIAIFEKLLMFYAAMSIGQQFKNRIAGAIISYFCIYAALQVLGTVFLVAFGVATSFDGFDSFENIFSSPTSGIYFVLAFVIVYEVLLSLAYYYITRYFLVKKLNLE